MRTRIVLIAIVLSFSLPAVPQTSTAANSDDANSRQARKLLDQCVKALGGEAYLTFTNVKQSGRGYGFSINGASGIGLAFTRYYVFPDQERYEYLKDHSWIVIHKGPQGFETTFRGTKVEDPKEVANYNRRRQFWLEVVLRDWPHQKGTAFFYDGATIADTRQVEKITIINPSNQSVSLYVDAKSFLPIKKSYTYRDPEDNQMSEEAELYDKYHLVQGINTPSMVTRTKNDRMTSQRFITGVEYNSSISDALFVPPPLKYDPTKK